MMRERKRNVITVSGSIAEEGICDGIVTGYRKPPACSITSGSDTVFPNSLRVFYSKQTNNDIFLITFLVLSYKLKDNREATLKMKKEHPQKLFFLPFAN